MSTTTITRCDECGKTKGDVNHWWNVWVSNKGLDVSQLRIAKWTDAHGDPTVADVCGRECLVKRVSKYCAGQLVEEAKTEEAK